MGIKIFIGQLLFDYVPNRIIDCIPSWRIRRAYYQKALKIKIDKNAFIQMGCYIYRSFSELHIGENTIINRNCTLDRRGGLYIGANVNISAEVAIYTGGHQPNSSDFGYYQKKVVIEDHVWLGTRSMIMPGVHVKKGALVLPGAIVTKDVEEYCIVGGIPAIKCGERTDNLSYELSWRPILT